MCLILGPAAATNAAVDTTMRAQAAEFVRERNLSAAVAEANRDPPERPTPIPKVKRRRKPLALPKPE